MNARVEGTFESWRETARALLRNEVEPSRVEWTDALAPSEARLFLESEPARREARAPSAAPPRVPKEFIELARSVACHRDPRRWPLLYEALWRVTHGERALLGDPLDALVASLRRMEKSVRRDLHKMKAFVRFRRVLEPDGAERYVAWHRPDHRIVERIAPFFVGRFNTQRWSILTPDRCAHWSDGELSFSPGVARGSAPTEDEVEALWLTYYAHVFNPARLNLRAMKRELPVRHWQTLPEAELIPELVRDAEGRTEQMIDDQPDPYPTAAAFLPRTRSIRALRAAAKDCRGCPLYADATQTVFGEGNTTARLLLVGEQPGDQEDIAGRPFVGPAGRLLDEMLAEAGVDRRKAYVTNAVKHFRYEIRGKKRLHSKPTRRMVTACQAWIEAEIAAIDPEVIVCLGAVAAESLLGTAFRITRQRGEWVENRFEKRLLATFHPSAVLRAPDERSRDAMRRAVVADLTKVARECPGVRAR